MERQLHLEGNKVSPIDRLVCLKLRGFRLPMGFEDFWKWLKILRWEIRVPTKALSVPQTMMSFTIIHLHHNPWPDPKLRLWRLLWYLTFDQNKKWKPQISFLFKYLPLFSHKDNNMWETLNFRREWNIQPHLRLNRMISVTRPTEVS